MQGKSTTREKSNAREEQYKGEVMQGKSTTREEHTTRVKHYTGEMPQDVPLRMPPFGKICRRAKMRGVFLCETAWKQNSDQHGLIRQT
ncbi:hypothetical protein POVCU2_0019120 [Plasmodium ovale curtisi]|uniref:Uncharacterized protein n=1 Tax=Plasmodium ovale curtisi TaxID=864141 RepID=A0A1A8WF78_PLAOA|nr:hypothetical protein POVCU2_0019120 [Plasmodium ovale curtisi]SBS89845.1 hypothetical protein POVCU1_017140 [Plasmodium ovale curtisi]